MEHAQSIAVGFHSAIAAHRDYRKRPESLRGKDICLAFDEWNYFWGDRYDIRVICTRSIFGPLICGTVSCRSR